MFYQVTVFTLILCCDFSLLLSHDKCPHHTFWRVSEPDMGSGASLADSPASGWHHGHLSTVWSGYHTEVFFKYKL